MSSSEDNIDEVGAGGGGGGDVPSETPDTLEIENESEAPAPQKQPTLQEILQFMAQKMDALTAQQKQWEEKMRHFDQFREDTLAQLDNLSNIAHEAKVGGGGSAPVEDGKPQMSPVNADAIKGIIDSVGNVVQNGFDMYMKIKQGTLADPLDNLRMEYGDRVLRKVTGEDVRTEARHVQKPVRMEPAPEPVMEDSKNKYNHLYVRGHGHSKNIR